MEKYRAEKLRRPTTITGPPVYGPVLSTAGASLIQTHQTYLVSVQRQIFFKKIEALDKSYRRHTIDILMIKS
jgi:hypothetical protein